MRRWCGTVVCDILRVRYSQVILPYYSGVVTKLNYSAAINSTKVMHTSLKNVVLDSVEWREASGYPIAMKSLATLFLNSVLEGYVGLPTVGNNFLQPLLGKVNTVIHEEYIAIYQSSNIQATQ